MKYSVARLVFEVIAADKTCFEKLSNYKEFAIAATEESNLFVVHQNVAWQAYNRTLLFDSEHEGMTCSVYKTEQNYLQLESGYLQDFLRVTICPDQKCVWVHHAIQDINGSLLNAVLQFAYNYFALPLGVFMIHASAVVYQNKAYLFLGKSGTGKSTHAKLWLQHIDHTTQLNDDGPILRNEDGVWHAYGSPWSGKGSCYQQAHYPIGGIARLEQAPANKVQVLTATQSYVNVLPSVFKWLYNKELFEKQAQLLSHMVQQVPCYYLQCLPQADAAYLLFNTMVCLNQP